MGRCSSRRGWWWRWVPAPSCAAAYPDEPALDAGGRVVLPGFVDPHTHVIWVGDRSAEFEMRLQGKTYLEILAAGGGILSTVKATWTASLEKLMQETRPRLWSMFNYGTTTAEAKTGYGLRTSTELRMLQALLALDREGPLELAITFLGAHAIPPDYKDRADEYTDLICVTMLPVLKDWWPHNAPFHPMPFRGRFLRDRRLQPGAVAPHPERRPRAGFPLENPRRRVR